MNKCFFKNADPIKSYQISAFCSIRLYMMRISGNVYNSISNKIKEIVKWYLQSLWSD